MEDLRGGVLTLEHRYNIQHALAPGPLGQRYRGTLEGFGAPIDVQTFDVLGGLGAPERVTRSVLARVLDHLRQASLMRSRHAVRVLDYGALSDDDAFCVTDGVRGPHLGAILAAQGQLPLDGLVRVISELAEALEELHAQGRGHWAVRPEHVWFEDTPTGTWARLGGAGCVLLAHELRAIEPYAAPDAALPFDHLAPETFDDPGCARWLDTFGPDAERDEDDAGDTWREPLPVAQDVAPSPEPQDHVAADVFALAVLAYRGLVGAHPFMREEDSPWRAKLQMMKQAELIDPSDRGVELAPEVWRVLRGGLTIDPGARPTRALEFAERLRKAARGQPATTKLSAVGPRSPDPTRETFHEIPALDAAPSEPAGPLLWSDDPGAALDAELDAMLGPDLGEHDPRGGARGAVETLSLFEHPVVRYLVAGLVVLVVTNLLTLLLVIERNVAQSPDEGPTPSAPPAETSRDAPTDPALEAAAPAEGTLARR